MFRGTLYKINNQINGKCYIGQTTKQNPYDRINQHFRLRKCKFAIHHAIEKYGKENFTIDLLCTTFTQDILNELEIYYIKEFNSLSPYGYNIAIGGGAKGTHTKEIIEKRINSFKKYCIINGYPAKGRKWSEESKKNFSELIKKTRSKDHYINFHIAQRKSIIKPIVAINIITQKEEYFECIKDCCKKYNIDSGNIIKAIKDTTRTCKGFKFRYDK